jgi:HSP20 family protein
LPNLARRVERRYGSFARVFTLPNTLDPDSVKANYAGVLTIELGKRAEAKPNQIKVSVRSATPTSGPKTVDSKPTESKSTESKPAA